MKVLECKTIKEKAYTEVLDNGLKVFIIPKKESNKKYVIWGTNFGSNDNKFIVPQTGEEVTLPDGVAHFLEHKMFEQPDETNSLDTMMALGLDANAYTTNDHTAYLFECSEDENFYKGLDELMDYVQSPHYTEKNVEKEKGIIGQEIMMYDDDPGFQLYLDTMMCLYSKNPIRLDIAGSIESISGINPEMLYKCYNTFYNPSNMVLCVCGNFDPDDMLKQIKSRLKPAEHIGDIKRIYEDEPDEICQNYMEKEMSISMPIFMIGVKDRIVEPQEKIKRHLAIQIVANILIGKSSSLYKDLYDNQLLTAEPEIDYEFSRTYAHLLIGGQSNNPQQVEKMWKEEVQKLKNNGIPKDDFERIKRKIYGEYVTEFNDVSNIARLFLSDTIKDVNTFDYIEKYDEVTLDYANQILGEVFDENKMALSVIKGPMEK